MRQDFFSPSLARNLPLITSFLGVAHFKKSPRESRSGRKLIGRVGMPGSCFAERGKWDGATDSLSLYRGRQAMPCHAARSPELQLLSHSVCLFPLHKSYIELLA